MSTNSPGTRPGASPSATLSYTNHTLLPEALESWPVALLNRLLPRHMQIIYLINKLHLDEAVAKGITDPAMLAVDLADPGRRRQARAHGALAFVGSHKINGVSALHTDLMRQTVFRDLDRAAPGRIVNMTNGISFRRWLFEANPDLTALLIEHARRTGARRSGRTDRARALCRRRRASCSTMPRPGAATRRRWPAHPRAERRRRSIPAAMFDVQIKRIHEYKRQLLNILETDRALSRHRGWSRTGTGRRGSRFSPARPPRATSAPSSSSSSPTTSAQVVNADPTVGGRLKVVFLPNYNVSLAQDDHSGRRPVGADFDRRHGSLRHRQHEARAQRRADDRHARRRQHRNSRPGRRRQHLHFRADRGRGRGAAASAFHRPGGGERIAACCRRRSRCIRSGAFSPDDPDRFRRSSKRCSTTTISWWRPISTPTGRRSGRSMRSTASPAGGAPRFSTPRAWDGFRRIARSANTPTRYGT